MKKTIILSLIIAITSCNSKPSKSKIEEDATNAVKENHHEDYELVSFNKENALEREVNSIKYYDVEFRGTIAANSDFFVDKVDDKEYLKIYSQKEMATKYERYAKVISQDMFEQRFFEKIKKGDILNVTGKLEYELAENGWRLTKNRAGKPYIKLLRAKFIDKDCKDLDKIKKTENEDGEIFTRSQKGDTLISKTDKYYIKSIFKFTDECECETEYKIVETNNPKLEFLTTQNAIMKSKVFDITKNKVRATNIYKSDIPGMDSLEFIGIIRILE